MLKEVKGERIGLSIRYNPSGAPEVVFVITAGQRRYFDNVAGLRRMNELAVAYVQTAVSDTAAASRCKNDNVSRLQIG
jgi:hypothetical protein